MVHQIRVLRDQLPAVSVDQLSRQGDKQKILVKGG